MKATEIYDRVTAQVIKSLESVDADAFRLPWHFDANEAHLFVPRNVTTKRKYKGGNVIALWASAIDQEFATGWWGTYKQWQALTGEEYPVVKGEKATHCIKWVEKITQDEDHDGMSRRRRAMIPAGFALFNFAQVKEGLWTPPVVKEGPDAVEHAEHFFTEIGAKVVQDTKAYFAPRGDFIGMPDLRHFDDVESYYATLAHEHVHWTAAESRVNRETNIDETSESYYEDYAREELVAELGSAFLCAHLGISNEPRADHAQYLKGWLRAIKDDPRAIYKAASLAQTAADFLVAAAHDVPVEAKVEDEVAVA